MKDQHVIDRVAREQRRRTLKFVAAGLFASHFPAALSSLAANTVAGEEGKGGSMPRILIAYYSRTGNTRAIAAHIQSLVGGENFEIQTVVPYPDEYKATTVQAKKELEAGYKPPLRGKVENIAPYDVVFIGSPNWWGTIAPPVMTFLSEHDLSGKIVAPFITHEGSALGRSMGDVRALCPNSTVVEGLAVRGSRAASAKDEVAAWLRATGIQK
ncbi:flavodoxin [Nitratidesulfovibrio sp.]|uniref:flavodoxin n=1 Tax=Nitratidesulfovibrio sp. TaxID=2802297 RepID=UPI00333F253E